MQLALGTYTRMTGLPSSICSRKLVPGSIRGQRSDSVRAGMSGKATSRARVEIHAALPLIIEVDVGGHAGAQGRRGRPSTPPALRTCHWRDPSTGLISLMRPPCFSSGAFTEITSTAWPRRTWPKSFSGRVKRMSSGPSAVSQKIAVSFGNILSFAHITPGDQSTKRSNYFCLFQFQFQGVFFLLSSI